LDALGFLQLFVKVPHVEVPSLHSRQTAIDALRAIIHEQTGKYQFPAREPEGTQESEEPVLAEAA
jgi:hypothetical protein